MFETVAPDPDREWLMIDATVIRANAQAAGAQRWGIEGFFARLK